MNASEIVIDPEFKKQMPPLTKEELDQLEKNILADGCRDSLVVWTTGNILLDGHNRREICMRHNITFSVIPKDLPDREAAIDWIDANQLGTRNVTDEYKKVLIGRIYERAKKRRGGQEDNANAEKRMGGNSPFVPGERISEKIAKEHGIPREKTVRVRQVRKLLMQSKNMDQIPRSNQRSTARTRKNVQHKTRLSRRQSPSRRPNRRPKRGQR